MITEMMLYRYTCDKCDETVDKIVPAGEQKKNLPMGWDFKNFASQATDLGRPYLANQSKLCCNDCMAQTWHDEWDYVQEHGWLDFEQKFCAWIDAHAHNFTDPEAEKKRACKSQAATSRVYAWTHPEYEKVSAPMMGVLTNEEVTPIPATNWTWNSKNIDEEDLKSDSERIVIDEIATHGTIRGWDEDSIRRVLGVAKKEAFGS